ncbi:MAG: hypothetical protein A3D31_10085 [Candidatus Fluviicola riflensis]|nr:MAG: hypothetical protein CHH17_14505 [Candidatus Fluviicola riflensis]OGS77353.1 MAG: hypothetical protein A3D31_10085 [Candidatus Fluviicola riflensis]OGS83933.1 MAG: hypothetical protein A3E30_11485 [Fluviicola sp. RIFCSPHIGHO2_12_FULL_43_24]OGS84420.1 MAG: hypothetical protein A2724_07025 [Fluviicola sp. RIFCSPHIGHO2_01_FULL_43_53]
MNMEKMTLFIAELMITAGLIYTVLTFWRRQLQKAYFLESSNKAYALFVTMQLLGLLLIVLQGIDPQGLVYMEDLSPFGAKSKGFWTFYGFQAIGFLFTYLVSVVLSQMVFKATFKSGKGLYKEISEDNWAPALIAGMIMVFFGAIISGIILRPLLLDWVSRNVGLVPLQ